jgi:hypothetical protein
MPLAFHNKIYLAQSNSRKLTGVLFALVTTYVNFVDFAGTRFDKKSEIHSGKKFSINTQQ